MLTACHKNRAVVVPSTGVIMELDGASDPRMQKEMTVGKPRRLALLAAATALVGSLVAVVHGGSATASTTDEAFNPGTGTLDVNYAGYLSKHDVVYNSPQTN